MNTENQTMEFERRRVLEYSSSGRNTVVRNWIDVQHVVGPLYKGRETKNSWDEIKQSFYIFFPSVPDGIEFGRHCRDLYMYTSGEFEAILMRVGFDCAENYERQIMRAMENGRFIGNVEIAFLRQWNPELSNRCAQYRADYLERKREIERQEELKAEMERQEQMAKEKELREKLDKRARARYLGWADNMTALQFGKIRFTMEDLVRVKGQLMTRRDFVIQSIQNGLVPKAVDGVVTEYKRAGEWHRSKPKTEYRIYDGEMFLVVTKTEYQFAKFLEEKFR